MRLWKVVVSIPMPLLRELKQVVSESIENMPKHRINKRDKENVDVLGDIVSALLILI